MANSLRAKISKLRHDGNITNEEYQELISKLDGHDKQIRADMIDKFKKIIRSVSSSGYRDIDGDWVTPSCDTKRLFDELEKLEE